ncbi:hypothetical protein HDU76_002490 [Blyttiomyces sp. JEL0837]|nr:hypothetical protein HDU76_002490 [Blyttiomyces sp. JEL0837]
MPSQRRNDEENAPLLDDSDDRSGLPHGPGSAPVSAFTFRYDSSSGGLRIGYAWATIFLTSVVLIVILGIAHPPIGHFRRPGPWGGPPAQSGGISQEHLNYGITVCNHISRNSKRSEELFISGGPPKSVRRNPRFGIFRDQNIKAAKMSGNKKTKVEDGHPILIKNALLWDGVGGRFPNTDIAIGMGVIVKVGQNLQPSDVIDAIHMRVSQLPEVYRKEASGFADAFKIGDVEVVDAEGRVVSPGLVDQHSHVGASEWPDFHGTQDTNEAGDPVHPQVRVQDAFNVMDIGLQIVATGGVTSSLVLPGSGSLMGGEGYMIKHLKPKSNEGADMGINRGLNSAHHSNKMHGFETEFTSGSEPLSGAWEGKAWRWMKMACGENPKWFGSAAIMQPSSRMGEGWLFRERFEKARTIKRAQEDWCASVDGVMNSVRKEDAHMFVHERFPEDIQEESLVALLRRDVRLNVHCYQTHDIEMMVRNKHQFNFPIVTFHHATEAYLVADLLARENISAAIFADHSVYKREAYLHSVKAPQILHAAGAKFSFKSDHPVLNAQNLIYEAQKATHYGLDPDLAFMAVTSVPAERLGVGWRIGRIAEGYDADVLIWDRPPLDIGAHPLRVIIDGFTAHSIPVIPEPAKIDEELHDEITPVLDAPTVLDAYTISNISEIFASEGVNLKGKVVVEHGIITCVGTKCPDHGRVFDLKGGVVIPGLISANVQLGLEEIAQESTTHDGPIKSSEAAEGLVQAVDGLRVGNSKLLQYAYRHGVLTSISAPRSYGTVHGLSVAFRTGADSFHDAVIKPLASLHVTIGDEGKDDYASSVSIQLAKLARLLLDSTNVTLPVVESDPANIEMGNKAKPTQGPWYVEPFRDVVNGKYPLVVTVHDPNDISKLLAITRHPNLKRMRLVLAGASGAWSVADEIAAANVPVLLQPARCTPKSWESRYCKTPYARPETAMEILTDAGVKVLLSVVENDQTRSLLFEAGWAFAEASASRLTEEEALGAVTWRVADAFGLGGLGVGKIVVGGRANCVGLNGGPFGFGVQVQILGDGKNVVTLPSQP